MDYQKLMMRLEEMSKRLAELEYRNQAMPKKEELEELIKILKDAGVQRFSMGILNIEMPYVPQVAGASTPL